MLNEENTTTGPTRKAGHNFRKRFNILFVLKKVMLESGFKEGTEKRVTTNIKETTLRNLLDAAYCQDVSTLTFTQACDLLQAALFYEFDHICKIVVKFLVQCCRHRCPESCCMFEVLDIVIKQIIMCKRTHQVLQQH